LVASLPRHLEYYPNVSQDIEDEVFKQFSFPGGIPSHAAPETPVPSMKVENWVMRFPCLRAAFDNPDLVVCCVVGDGKPKLDLWLPVGTPTSSSTPSLMVRCCLY